MNNMAISTDSILVVLDAGHSLHTPGKRTPDGIKEWTLNDTVTRGFDEQIKKYKGVKTHRLDDETGQTDISLTNRTNIANQIGADFVISFHHNANTGQWGTWGGTETWVQDRASEELGLVLQTSIVKTLGLRDRGLKFGNLHMNRESDAISCLVEVGFMDSLTDKVIRIHERRHETGVQMAIAFAKHYGLSEEKPASKPLPSVVKPTTNGIVSEIGNELVLTTNVYERNNPTIANSSGLKLRNKGEVLEYNAYTIEGGYNWIRLTSGKWLPWRETKGEKYGYIRTKVNTPKPVVPKPVPPVKNKPSGQWKNEKGTFILGTSVYERNEPDTSNNVGLKKLPSGTKVPYDAYLIKGGYVWLRKITDGKVIPWRIYKGETWGKVI